jgi:three-Cys-motif partner protein
MAKNKSFNNNKKKTWGGKWTETKLDAFEKYVKAYLSIMSKYPYWKIIYFDGFAGSGERKIENEELFSQLSIDLEELNVYQGAAERVVKIDIPITFDYYYFIDKNEESSNKLRDKIISNFPDKKESFVFRNSECDLQLRKLAEASKDKRKNLASLIFLDPFGMQISWDAIRELKGTRSDVWILIPTGVIVNRLLDRKGELKSINKLQDFFGMTEEEIRKQFYKTEIKLNLFGEEENITHKVLDPINHIARIYKDNLKTIWKHVTEVPLRLDNSVGTPIFHFVFASNNQNAVKIAQEVIKNI